MQLKVMILSALFFVRFQGGSQSLDDFFTFARKYVGEKQANDTSFVYRAELNTLLIAQARETWASSSLESIKNMVSRMYHSLLDTVPMRHFSTDAAGIRDDIGQMQLRKLLLTALERVEDNEARYLIVRLILRFGVTRASSEDLLIAAQL